MADQKRTILFPKPSSTIGSLSPDRILSKVKSIFIRNIQPRSRGLEGNIFTIDRQSSPPIVADWEVSYSKGIGKTLRSKVLENRVFGSGNFTNSGVPDSEIRGKSGPRFKVKIKF